MAALARDELDVVTDVTSRINELHRRIADMVGRAAPTLLAMPGVGSLTAAKFVGEAAGITRFTSAATFARHAGIAPIPVWSGNSKGRARLTRSGNRQLNAAIHRIALTQTRLDGLGHTSYQKAAEGMSSPEDLRYLTRCLAHMVYNHLTTDAHLHSTHTPTCQPATA